MALAVIPRSVRKHFAVPAARRPRTRGGTGAGSALRWMLPRSIIDAPQCCQCNCTPARPPLADHKRPLCNTTHASPPGGLVGWRAGRIAPAARRVTAFGVWRLQLSIIPTYLRVSFTLLFTVFDGFNCFLCFLMVFDGF